MLKRRFILFVFFLNMLVYLPGLNGDNDSQKLLNEVKELQKQGLNITQIYNKLKLKNESLGNFAMRLERAKEGKSITPSSDIYPYQKPQNFNPNHVRDDYYFLGDITIYGNSADSWQLKDANGKLITTLKANKLKQLSPLGVKSQGKDIVYNEMQKFRINDGKNITYIFSPSNKNLPEVRVFIEKNKDLITLYIGNPTTNKQIAVKDSTGKEHTETVEVPAKGFKIIFDNNKFRDYLTQTFFYKLMLANYKYPVVGFGVGFSIDPTKIALINTGDLSQVISLFNIKLIFKIIKRSKYIKPGRTDPKEVKMDTFYDSEPLSKQEKINEQNYKEQIKYADLFAVGAIKVEPLNSEDAKKIDSIK